MSHTNAHRLPKSLRGFLAAFLALTAQIGHAAEEWKMGDDLAVFITASPHVQFSPDGAAAEIDGKNHGWHGVLLHTDPDKVKLGKGTVVLEFDLEVLEPFDGDAWLWATLEATSTATPDLPIGKFFDKRLDPDGSNTFRLVQTGKSSHKIEISRSPDFALASGGGFRAAFGLTKQGSFTTHGAGRMRISNVRLTSTPNGKPSVVLPAPKHLAPAEGVRLDPLALHFLWEDNSLAERFQIEIAGEQIPGGKTSHDVPSMGADASSFIVAGGLPEGDYRWRVRSVTADGTLGEWSPEASFSVHAPGAPVPPLLALSPDNPLFFFMVHDDRQNIGSFGDGSPEQEKWPVRRFLQYRKQWSALPPEVKKHAAFEVMFSKSGRFREWATEYDKLWRAAPGEYPDIVILGRLFNDVWNLSYLTLPLSDFEWICRQDYPWFKGVSVVEQHVEWGGWNQEYLKRLLSLAAQYGQRVYWAEFGPQHVLNDRIGSDLIEVMRKHRDYLTIMHKCNSGIAPMLMMNQIFGQWFMGNAGTLGMSAEAWYWNSGYFSPEPLGGGPGSADRNQPGLYRQLYPAFPGTFWNIQLLLGAAQGAVVYRIEGAAEPEPPEEVYRGDFWDKNLEPNWNFARNIIPLLEFLVEKKAIPPARAVVDEVKAVVIDSNTFPYDWNDAMGPLGPFFQVAPGFHYTYQMVPNSGRYYFIPAIFGNTVDRSRLMVAADKQLEIFTAADAKDPGQLRRRLDALYPKRSEGEACVLFAGESFFVFNSWENEDKPQSFSFAPPSAPGITAISGVAGPQSYLAGRASAGALHLQCANLRDRQSTLNIKAAAEPALTVTPAAAVVSRKWENGQLSLVLKHDEGAVNLVVGQAQPEAKQAPPTTTTPAQEWTWPLSLRSFSAKALGFTDHGLVLQFDFPGQGSDTFGFRAGKEKIEALSHPGGAKANEVGNGSSVLAATGSEKPASIEIIPADASHSMTLSLGQTPTYNKLDWIKADPFVSTNYGPVQAEATFVAGGDHDLLRLSADFTGNRPGDYACMSFPTPPVSFGPASHVGLWIKGDNSGNAFSLSFTDAKGESFAYFLEKGINWNGWRFLTIPLVDHPKHPSRSSGHASADAGKIVWPLKAGHAELGYLQTDKSALEIIPVLYYSEK